VNPDVGCSLFTIEESGRIAASIRRKTSRSEQAAAHQPDFRTGPVEPDLTRRSSPAPPGQPAVVGGTESRDARRTEVIQIVEQRTWLSGQPQRLRVKRLRQQIPITNEQEVPIRERDSRIDGSNLGRRSAVERSRHQLVVDFLVAAHARDVKKVLPIRKNLGPDQDVARTVRIAAKYQLGRTTLRVDARNPVL